MAAASEDDGFVDVGKVSREGVGKRGDPYRYRFSFSCSHDIAGTREQEMPNRAHQSRINTAFILVPINKDKNRPRNSHYDRYREWRQVTMALIERVLFHFPLLNGRRLTRSRYTPKLASGRVR